ncbi:3'-5' exoribonuclease [bacterium]|nr:3'-5' exoribonuclease [bacterium]
MKYFLDTEFDEYVDELGRGIIAPISLGLTAEDGREYYAEFAEFDWQSADPWLVQNVLPHLSGPVLAHQVIAEQVRRFVADDDNPEFWAYVGSYDWVVLVQLFDKLISRPANWPNRHRELKDLVEQAGLRKSDLPTQLGSAHRAIDDARWNMEVYHFLMSR